MGESEDSVQPANWSAAMTWLGQNLGVHWALCVTVTLLASLAIFAGMVHFLRHYQSDGFLRAERPLAEINAQRASFGDKNNLLRYLKAENLMHSPGAASLLQGIGPGLMQTAVKVALPYTKEDLRFLPSDSLGSSILGFNISFAGMSPADAAARVQLMGDYLRDTMLREDLLNSIHVRAGEVRVAQRSLDNKLIVKRVELQEASRKLDALKVIAARYPEASKHESRQLLSSDTDSSRYLSPVMQLVGVESDIADIKNELMSLEREAAQNNLHLRFYAGAEKLDPAMKSGKNLLADLERLRVETFKDASPDDEQAREVANKIDLMAELLRTRHLVNTRFTSGPTLADRRTGPKAGLMLILSLAFGGMMGVAVVAAFDWIRAAKHRRLIDEVAGPGVRHS